jgi:hypothetical protein
MNMIVWWDYSGYTMRIKNKISVKIYGKIWIYWPLKEYYLGYFWYRIRFIEKYLLIKFSRTI